MVRLRTHKVHDRIDIRVRQAKLPRLPPRHRFVLQDERHGHTDLERPVGRGAPRGRLACERRSLNSFRLESRQPAVLTSLVPNEVNIRATGGTEEPVVADLIGTREGREPLRQTESSMAKSRSHSGQLPLNSKKSS